MTCVIRATSSRSRLHPNPPRRHEPTPLGEERPAAGTVEDFTALGDVVNTTARRACAAGAGEVIASVAVAAGAGTATEGLERRTVQIRGRTERIEVVVLRPAGPLHPS